LICFVGFAFKPILTIGVTCRSAERCAEHESLLAGEPHVAWFEQQEEKRRVKRDAVHVASRAPVVFDSIPDPLFRLQL
jgi:hypothetical protein